MTEVEGLICLSLQVERHSISPHPRYDQVELHLIVAQYDPPAFRKQAEHFASRAQKKDFRRKRVHIIPNEDHFSIVENLFYKGAALTRYIAGDYDNRQRAKL